MSSCLAGTHTDDSNQFAVHFDFKARAQGMALCLAYNTNATIQSPARNESRHPSIHSAPRSVSLSYMT